MFMWEDLRSVGFNLRGLDFREVTTAPRVKPTLRDCDVRFSMRAWAFRV